MTSSAIENAAQSSGKLKITPPTNPGSPLFSRHLDSNLPSLPGGFFCSSWCKPITPKKNVWRLLCQGPHVIWVVNQRDASTGYAQLMLCFVTLLYLI
jgi:hypothetical protein